MAPSEQDKSIYRKRAQQSWVFWNVVLSGVISYEEACRMDFDELYEANAALDLYDLYFEKIKNGKSKKSP